jgi:chondroitin sulfate proteoglycan 4
MLLVRLSDLLECYWFRLQGSNFGRILIWVNDGQLWVSTELKVRASPPFVRIENNTGIIVQR